MCAGKESGVWTKDGPLHIPPRTTGIASDGNRWNSHLDAIEGGRMCHKEIAIQSLAGLRVSTTPLYAHVEVPTEDQDGANKGIMGSRERRSRYWAFIARTNFDKVLNGMLRHVEVRRAHDRALRHRPARVHKKQEDRHGRSN